jgi:hypothetical protein
MSLIATGIEPHGVARIFFDCRPTEPDRNDEVRIAKVIEQAAANAAAPEAALPKELPQAA